jgi:acyl-CoA dehydrogenase
MAKLYSSEVANRVAYHCVQLHGGYGYMQEYKVERYYRDVRLITIGGGTSEIMKEIIGRWCFGL